MEELKTVLKHCVFAAAVLLLVAIIWCLSGCKTTSKTTKESIHTTKTDSSAFVQTAKLDTLNVPKQTAIASIPSKWLYDNPGTPYQASNGRATVSVKLVHDTIQVQADCDSLQKIVASINTVLYQMQQQNTVKQSSEVVHKVSIPWQLQLIGWLAVAAAIAYVVLSVLKYIKPL
jgi:hypothetical protein